MGPTYKVPIEIFITLIGWLEKQNQEMNGKWTIFDSKLNRCVKILKTENVIKNTFNINFLCSINQEYLKIQSFTTKSNLTWYDFLLYIIFVLVQIINYTNVHHTIFYQKSYQIQVFNSSAETYKRVGAFRVRYLKWGLMSLWY